MDDYDDGEFSLPSPFPSITLSDPEQPQGRTEDLYPLDESDDGAEASGYDSESTDGEQRQSRPAVRAAARAPAFPKSSSLPGVSEKGDIVKNGVASDWQGRAAAAREALMDDLQAIERSEGHISASNSRRSNSDDSVGLSPARSDTPGHAAAHEPLEEELKRSQEMTSAIKILEQVESAIELGPRWKLENYLEAVDQLLSVQEVVVSAGSGGEEEEQLVQHVQGMIARALADLEDEFKDAIQKSSKPFDPSTFTAESLAALSNQSQPQNRPSSSQVVPVRSISMTGHNHRPQSADNRRPSTSESTSRNLMRSGSLFKDDPMLDQFNSTAESSLCTTAATADAPTADPSHSRSNSSSTTDSAEAGGNAAAAAAEGARRPHYHLRASVSDTQTEVERQLPSLPHRSNAQRLRSNIGRATSFAGGEAVGSPRLAALQITQRKKKEWVPSTAAPWLHKIAQRLVQGGAGERCMELYKQVRAVGFKENLKLLQMVEFRSSALDAMPWPTMEGCIKSWVKDARIIMNVLVEGERILCHQVLGGLGLEVARCFSELLVESRSHRATILLGLNAKAIASSVKAPEKLFGLLDIFKTVEDLTPQAEEILRASSKFVALDEWWQLRSLLAGAVFATFDALKAMLDAPPLPSKSAAKPANKKLFKLNSLKWVKTEGKDKEDADVDTDVHAITSYVVNYIRHYLERNEAGRHAETLERIFTEHVDSHKSKRFLEAETMELLQKLEANMESRSLEMPPVQRAIFMVNNVNYVLTSMSNKQFRLTIRQRERLLKREEQFIEATTQKLARALGPAAESGALQVPEVKARLKKFNDSFEELALEQREWLILSDEVRKGLRVKLGKAIRELYAEFLTPHREDLCEISSYRWTPDGVERVIVKSFLLFRGIPITSSA